MYGQVGDVYAIVSQIQSITAITSARLGVWTAAADGWLEAQLYPTYAAYMPLSVDSFSVLRWAADYYACGLVLQSQFSQHAETESPWVEQFFDRAKEMIGPIVNSGALLPLLTTGLTPWSNTMQYTPTFDVGPMEWQRVDPERVRDLEDERGVGVG